MKKSSGILLYKIVNSNLEVFLVHPGGPFWRNKDDGSWSIPKGEFDDFEESLDAAKREFFEETGTEISGDFKELQSVKLKSGKVIFAFAVLGDIDPATIKSNDFEMEWPPKSSKIQQFPEVDRGNWFPASIAKSKVNVAQINLIEQLELFLNV